MCIAYLVVVIVVVLLVNLLSKPHVRPLLVMKLELHILTPSFINLVLFHNSSFISPTSSKQDTNIVQETSPNAPFKKFEILRHGNRMRIKSVHKNKIENKNVLFVLLGTTPYLIISHSSEKLDFRWRTLHNRGS